MSGSKRFTPTVFHVRRASTINGFAPRRDAPPAVDKAWYGRLVDCVLAVGFVRPRWVIA